MTTLVFAVAGAVIGGAIGGPTGAKIGWMAGSMIGSALEPGQEAQGPRMADLKAQVSAPGQPIPIFHGSYRTACVVIWEPEIRETEHTQSGKGSGPTMTTYTYSVDAAVLIGRGTISTVRKIWMNSALVYDTSNGEPPAPKGFTLTIYPGDEAQMPDPTMEAAFGVGNVPAYRGNAYMVIKDLQLADYGNRLPQIEVEVLAAAPTLTSTTSSILQSNVGLTTRDPNTGYFISVKAAGAGVFNVSVWDEVSRSTIYTGTVSPGGSFAVIDIEFISSLNEIWVAGQGTGSVRAIILSAATYTQIDTCTYVNIGFNQAHIYYEPTNNNIYLTGHGSIDTVVITPGTRLLDTALSTGLYDARGLFLDTTPYSIYMVPVLPFMYSCFYDTYGVVTLYMDLTHTLYFRHETAFAAISDVVFDLKRMRLYVVSGGDDFIDEIDLLSFTVTRHSGLIGSVVGGNSCFLKQADRLLVASSSAFRSWWLINVDSWTLESATTLASTFNSNAGIWEIQGSTDYVISNGGGVGVNSLLRVYPFATVTANPVTLRSIVESICVDSGLLLSEVDATALTETIEGYAISRPMTARAAIQPLQFYGFFDVVESERTLKFVLRGSNPRTIIPYALLGAGEATGEGGAKESIVVRRLQETELPRRITIMYPDASQDYQPATQTEKRLITNALIENRYELPVVMGSQKAKKVVQTLMYEAWMNRSSFKFSTLMTYARLEPTDVVYVQSLVGQYCLRLTKKNERGAMIAWEASPEDSSLYARAGAGSAASTINTGQIVVRLASTTLYLLDIPALQDGQAFPGIYAVMYGVTTDTTSWPGATLFESSDAGSSWDQMGSVANTPGVGFTGSILPDFFGGNIFDEASTVTVRVVSGVELVSVTELAVLNGANAALIGSELIQYKNAALIGANTYTLSGLLRGRRGTEQYMGSHSSAELFISFASNAGILHPDTDLSVSREFKAVTNGAPLDTSGVKTITNTGQSVMPYSPVFVRAFWDAANDITIKWVRRGRIMNEWRDNIDVPVGEVSELYDVEIWDSTYSTLKRTFTGLATPTTPYTSAQQVTDFGSNQTTLYVKVFQKSDTIGRGFPAIATL